MKIVGKTATGIEIVSNILHFVHSQGIPLDIVLDGLKSHNMMPCWQSLQKESMLAGWTNNTFLFRLENAVKDIYGEKFWLAIEGKLK